MPGTAPLANKADEPVKAKDDESVIKLRAERAKWKKVFDLIYDKVTRANAPKVDPVPDLPPLEDFPVRPYEYDDKMTIEKNATAKIRWEFKEQQLVVTRLSEKKEATSREKARANRQAAADRAEAKLYLSSLQTSFASVAEAYTKHGGALTESLLKTRLGAEMVTSGQREHIAASDGYRKDYKAATAVPRALLVACLWKITLRPRRRYSRQPVSYTTRVPSKQCP